MSVSHLRVAANIVHVNAKQVSQTMRHEDGTHVNHHHVVHVARQNADLHELLQVNAVRQTVHVSPLHTCSNTFAIICKIVLFLKAMSLKWMRGSPGLMAAMTALEDFRTAS